MPCLWTVDHTKHDFFFVTGTARIEQKKFKMLDAYICDAIRTPFGRYGGSLAAIRSDDLAALVLKALSDRNPSLNLEEIDDVILGCANQAGEDNRNVARMATLLAGWPIGVAGTTVNRLCASSLDAVGIAARAIGSGDQEIVVAGGVESMSRAPYVIGKNEAPFSRNMKLEDTTIGWRFVNDRMKAAYGVDSMPETAENVARVFGISRIDQDSYALRSQMRWAQSQQNKVFSKEIVSVDITQKNGNKRVFEVDEHPRPETTLAKLSALTGVVSAGGAVTAGNSSGVNDGACAILLASQSAISRHGLVPRARILGMTAVGVQPSLMGIGPAPAIKKLLNKLDIRLTDVDVLELNEAFASQTLAVIRDLGISDDADWVNPNGGAIAIGHPLGASGARLVTTLINQLENIDGRYGVASMCVGVGQGVAVALERVKY